MRSSGNRCMGSNPIFSAWDATVCGVLFFGRNRERNIFGCVWMCDGNVQTGCKAAPESGADIIFIEKRRSYMRAKQCAALLISQ